MSNNGVPNAESMSPSLDLSTEVGAMLDATTRGEMRLTELTEALLARGRGDTDAVWEMLALVDQYFRRRRIGAEVSSTIKAELHGLVFNKRPQAGAPISPVKVERSVQHAAVEEDSELLRDIVRANKLIYESAPEDTIAAQMPPMPLESPVVAEPVRSQESSIGEVRSDKQQVPAAEVISALDGPRLHFSEPTYAPGISTRAKAALGIGFCIAVVAALVYLSSSSNPAPTNAPATAPASLASNATEVSDQPKEQIASGAQDPVAGDVQTGMHASPPAAAEPLLAPPLPTAATAVAAAELPVNAVAPVQPATSDAPVVADVSTKIAVSAPPTAATELPAAPATLQRVSVLDDPIVVDKGDAVARIAVRRIGSTSRELSLPWRTLEGSAKAHRDYVPATDSMLSFSVGTRDAFILVPIVQDATRPHSDWFEVEIGATSGTSETAPPIRVTVLIASAQVTATDETPTPSGASDTP